MGDVFYEQIHRMCFWCKGFNNHYFCIFNISFLHNHRVKYDDYIVKWCSGVACNWCVSLYIGLTLALSLY